MAAHLMKWNMNEPKHPGGRPEFEATDERRRTVKAMAAYGIPQLDIAAAIGCTAPTLRKHFWREIETAATEANARVAEALFKKATDGTGKESVTAAIFWLKCRAGWRDGNNEAGGKKAQVEDAAKTAGEGTGWGDDLTPRTSLPN